MILENQIAAGRTGPLTVPKTNAEVATPGFAGFVDGAMADGPDTGESGVGGDGGLVPDGFGLADQSANERKSAQAFALASSPLVDVSDSRETPLNEGANGASDRSGDASRKGDAGRDRDGMPGQAGLVLSQAVTASAAVQVGDSSALDPASDSQTGSVRETPRDSVSTQDGVTPTSVRSVATEKAAHATGFMAEQGDDEGIGAGFSGKGAPLASTAQLQKTPIAPSNEPAMVRVGDGESAKDAAVPAQAENAANGAARSDRGAVPVGQPLARPAWAAAPALNTGGTSVGGLVSAELSARNLAEGDTGKVSDRSTRNAQRKVSGGPLVPLVSVTTGGEPSVGAAENRAEYVPEPGLDGANKTADRMAKEDRAVVSTPNPIDGVAGGRKADSRMPAREVAMPSDLKPAFGRSERGSEPGPGGLGPSARAAQQGAENGSPVVASGSRAATGLPGMLAGNLGARQDASLPLGKKAARTGTTSQNTPSERMPAAPAQAIGLGQPVNQPPKPAGVNAGPVDAAVSWRAGGENTSQSPMPTRDQEAPSAPAQTPIKVGAGVPVAPQPQGTFGVPGQSSAGLQNGDLFQRARDALDRDPLALDADPVGTAPEIGSLRPGHATAAANRAQANILAPRLVQQITTAAVGLADGPVELRLNPEELGHVRLRLESRDGSMAVLVTAERAETLDMLRRNIEQLAAGLRDVGYQELSFGFAGQDQAGADGSRQETTGPESRSDSTPAPPVEAEPVARAAPVRTKSGVDIRL